jgi:hypothetical protein
VACEHGRRRLALVADLEMRTKKMSREGQIGWELKWKWKGNRRLRLVLRSWRRGAKGGGGTSKGNQHKG